MKYIEELSAGDTFTQADKVFIMTCDFKSNGKRLGIRFDDGFPIWFDASSMVEPTPVYQLDKDNNVVPIKYVASQTSSIS